MTTATTEMAAGSNGLVKLSDYVAEFLAGQGLRHVFAVAGGASLHLIDSIARTPNITYVCPQHEQAGAMAADAYSRMTRNLGAAIGTSGPGATNMITGICCAYYDSVPVVYITGQVATFRTRNGTGVRQLGFQETDTVEMCRPITKYAVRLENPAGIRHELEKAVHIARSDRPGPVLLDIPDDLQRTMVERDGLPGFTPPPRATAAAVDGETIRACDALISASERPVLVLGWGVRLANAEADAMALADRLGIPVLPTWAMRDLVPSDHPLFAGSFGTHGTRCGNFVIQNADLVLSIGSRLDTHETGSPLTSFARGARKIVVDIDPAELGKFERLGATVDVAVECDAGRFIRAFLENSRLPASRSFGDWLARVAGWKAAYPACPPEFYEEDRLNPYVFMKALAEEAPSAETFLLDTGCTVTWMMQAFDFKAGQRAIHAFNNTPMGYALPASVGASIALGGAPVTCLSGDGSFQLNLQELATVLYHELPVRIFVIDNQGYSMIQQTQDQWFDSRYDASSVKDGLAFPDFRKVAEAYGYPTWAIRRNAEAHGTIREIYSHRGAAFCVVHIDPSHRVVPQTKYGRPIEDSEPLLDRAEFRRQMIVEPDPRSLVENDAQ